MDTQTDAGTGEPREGWSELSQVEELPEAGREAWYKFFPRAFRGNMPP